jgi:mannose/cellobiose epimerase-like protein (N-acyl-D-glucosamine 2-epimerase family)
LRQARFADQPELKEYCRKLYATSHAFGHARGTDAVCDSMAPDGSEMLGTARLWCQTEALKAGLLARAEGSAGRRDTVHPHARRYLQPLPDDTDAPGGWYDQIDSNGRVISKHMPTSTFYHVFCALVEYLRHEEMLLLP